MTMRDESERDPLNQELDDLREEAARWKRAHVIACSNITELNDQRALLTEALNNATILLDQLLTEMRLKDVTPSPGVIVVKAEFDRAMRKLLGHEQAQALDT